MDADFFGPLTPAIIALLTGILAWLVFSAALALVRSMASAGRKTDHENREREDRLRNLGT